MNAQRMTRIMLAGAVALALTALTVLIVALPATAGPNAQDGWTPIPTPTPYPVDDLVYQLDTVGGDASPQVFPGQEVDGVTFGETIVETDFPDSLTLRTIISADWEIDRANVIITYRNGAEQALTAQVTEEPQTWTSTWDLDKEFPAWSEFDFQWCVTDTEAATVCTDPQPITLIDRNQVWNRVTTKYAILYWYGFGEDRRDYIARRFTYAATSTHQRLLDGFGRDISFKPIFLIYPDEESAHQVLGGAYWGFLDIGYFTNAASLGLGAIILTPPDMAETYPDCTLFPSGAWSDDYRFRSNIESDTMWSFVTYFQAKILRTSSPATANGGWDGVNFGPYFWMWGQSRWFIDSSFGDWPYEEHVHQVAAEHGLKSLRSFGQSDFMGPDGCPGFIDDVGASFINWLVYHYGIETHRQIVELMIPTEDNPRGMDFYDAIEQATGKPFDDLENEWRAYLELPPLE